VGGRWRSGHSILLCGEINSRTPLKQPKYDDRERRMLGAARERYRRTQRRRAFIVRSIFMVCNSMYSLPSNGKRPLLRRLRPFPGHSSTHPSTPQATITYSPKAPKWRTEFQRRAAQADSLDTQHTTISAEKLLYVSYTTQYPYPPDQHTLNSTCLD